MHFTTRTKRILVYSLVGACLGLVVDLVLGCGAAAAGAGAGGAAGAGAGGAGLGSALGGAGTGAALGALQGGGGSQAPTGKQLATALSGAPALQSTPPGQIPEGADFITPSPAVRGLTGVSTSNAPSSRAEAQRRITSESSLRDALSREEQSNSADILGQIGGILESQGSSSPPPVGRPPNPQIPPLASTPPRPQPGAGAEVVSRNQRTPLTRVGSVDRFGFLS